MRYMSVIVKNAAKTAGLDSGEYGYDSWREYWSNNGGWNFWLFRGIKRVNENGQKKWKLTFRCPACGKNYLWNGTAPDCFDGCHVNIVGDATKKLYITPLCHTCNQKNITADVLKVNLVPAP